MKIAVFSSRYPTPENHYSHTFVHTRSLEYLKQGCEVQVYVPSRFERVYKIEGVDVIHASAKKIISMLSHLYADAYAIHLLHPDIDPVKDGGGIYDFLIHKTDQPILHFFHGIDALHIFKHRKHEAYNGVKGILRAVYRDFYVLNRLSEKIHLLNGKNKTVFIFPSQWLKNQAEQTFNIYFNNYQCIPSGIDCSRFVFNENAWANRHKLLSIRPLEKHYAYDLTCNTMSLLPKEFRLTFIGKGTKANAIRNEIKRLDLNINLCEHFIPNNEISKYHQQHGMYLASTKMDTQGVSACEAMASGLVVFSYKVQGVSDFIIDNENGFLAVPDNFKQNAEKIMEVVENRDLFEKISFNARKSMEEIDVKITTAKELEFIKNK